MAIKDVLLLPFQIIWSLVEAFFIWIVGHRSKDIRGQVLLITGGGQGIGRCLALGFANKGAKVVILDIDDKASAETTRLVLESGGFCQWYHCDVAKKSEVSKVARIVRDEVGDVNILVNNAGIFNGQCLLDVSESNIKKIFDVNILSQIWTVQEFLPNMMSRNEGHIINISSAAGKFGAAFMVDYCATKFSVDGFGEALKAELRRKKKNICVTTVYPGLTRTALVERLLDKLYYKDLGKCGYGGYIKPEEVATAVVEGSLKNKEYIYVPWIFKLVIGFTNSLPYKTLEITGLSEFGMHEKEKF